MRHVPNGIPYIALWFWGQPTWYCQVIREIFWRFYFIGFCKFDIADDFEILFEFAADWFEKVDEAIKCFFEDGVRARIEIIAIWVVDIESTRASRHMIINSLKRPYIKVKKISLHAIFSRRRIIPRKADKRHAWRTIRARLNLQKVVNKARLQHSLKRHFWSLEATSLTLHLLSHILEYLDKIVRFVFWWKCDCGR